MVQGNEELLERSGWVGELWKSKVLKQTRSTQIIERERVKAVSAAKAASQQTGGASETSELPASFLLPFFALFCLAYLELCFVGGPCVDFYQIILCYQMAWSSVQRPVDVS